MTNIEAGAYPCVTPYRILHETPTNIETRLADKERSSLFLESKNHKKFTTFGLGESLNASLMTNLVTLVRIFVFVIYLLLSNKILTIIDQINYCILFFVSSTNFKKMLNIFNFNFFFFANHDNLKK